MGTTPKPPKSAPLSYAQAGVDIAAGNEAVRRISQLVAQTRRSEQLDGLGGFAGMMRLPRGYDEPVLVACSDGVGTKLMVAIQAQRLDSIGIDLVAMCVNDLIVTGAEPLFLLDYIATGALEPGAVESIVSGIVEGCRQSGCSLLGGETAEMPGMYAKGHFDVAATAVGVVEGKAIWEPAHTKAGDLVYALPSDGLHSNGYSLARKALLDPAHAGLALDARFPGSEQSVADVLLTPTRIYWPAFRALRELEFGAVHGAAHITGGGLLENPQRAIAPDLAVEIDLSKLELPPVFRAIAQQGVDAQEMLRTFNCGVGMLVYVDPEQSGKVEDALRAAGEDFVLVGQLKKRGEGPAVLLDPAALA